MLVFGQDIMSFKIILIAFVILSIAPNFSGHGESIDSFQTELNRMNRSGLEPISEKPISERHEIFENEFNNHHGNR